MHAISDAQAILIPQILDFRNIHIFPCQLRFKQIKDVALATLPIQGNGADANFAYESHGGFFLADSIKRHST